MSATITQIYKEKIGTAERGLIKVAFSTADVKALGTAVEVIPAPGSGKVIMAEDLAYSLTFASAAFATSTTVYGILDTATSATFSFAINQSASDFMIYTANNNATLSLIANKAFQIVTSNAVNPTAGGTSTINLYIKYKIITL